MPFNSQRFFSWSLSCACRRVGKLGSERTFLGKRTSDDTCLIYVQRNKTSGIFQLIYIVALFYYFWGHNVKTISRELDTIGSNGAFAF